MVKPANFPSITYLSMDPLCSTVGSSQVLPYVERLAQRDFSVKLVTFEHAVDATVEARLEDLGVTWQPEPFGRRGTVGGLGRVLRGARELRGATVVHARSDMAAAATMLAGVDRWVWDVRSLWADQKVATGVLREGSIEERLMRWIERRAARRARAVITLTRSAIDELDRRHGGTISAKAQVVTTCTDLDRFTLSVMPPLPIRVLLAGTLNRYYDMQSMLELVDELRSRGPVEFVVASPGDTDWEDELAGEEVLRVSATPTEMPDLISSCHIGLCVCRDDAGPSLRAAMPTKIAEFLASGRPIVVNSGLAEVAGLVEQYKCGVVHGASVSNNAVNAVNRLHSLLTDSQTPERCRALAESHFDLDWAVNRLISVYDSLSR